MKQNLVSNFGSAINGLIDAQGVRQPALVTDLSTASVVPLTMEVLTDDEGLGFDFGEEA